MRDVFGLIRETMKPRMSGSRASGQLLSPRRHPGCYSRSRERRPSRKFLREQRSACTSPPSTRRRHAGRRAGGGGGQGEGDRPRPEIAADPKNKNKPPNILEKIAEGKLKTFFAENVLVHQPFVKDTSKTVGDLLRAAGLKVVRFVRES